MGFNKFKELMQENFQKTTENISCLFEVNVDKDEMWDLYLNSFPNGTNDVFRERTSHDCNCCRNFIRNFGNVVIIKDNKIKSIWDFDTNSTTYQPVVNALSKYVKSKNVSSIHVSKFKEIGTNMNYEELLNGEVITWDHFYLELDDRFVDESSRTKGDICGDAMDTRNVFKRSLEEITKESLCVVLEIISQNSLYKGEEWKSILTEFLKHKKEYDKLISEHEKENYTWSQSVKISRTISRIRNNSIGTLLVNISNGMDLDTAVKKYESIIAPENYQRPKAIFTKKMLDEAMKKIQELGYLNSLGRRFATLDDITVNNVLFSNKDSIKKISGFNIFEEMASEIPISPKKFSKVEEISINDFVNNILPTTREIEVLLENKHSNNMVSLISPEHKDSKTMFKWDNGFSWAYSGNIADSSMKKNVKNAGGKVDGVLRFSIQWNDEDDYNPNDFDAHCIEPHGVEIYYGTKKSRLSGGELDVDIVNPRRDIPAVENITWESKAKMNGGNYSFFVKNYCHNGGRSGFKAEIEFDGEIYYFEHNKELKQGEVVRVADVVFDRSNFSIVKKMPSNSSVSSKEIWNIKTNQFTPVSVVMFSPNYWNKQDGIGNRHYFFMLKDCINTESPNGMFNEYLNNELNSYKRVMEAIGSKTRVSDTEYQLSGVGFSSTKRNSLIVKVKGQTERVLKIKF